MLRITVPSRTYWDENREEFITIEETVLELEHSLASVAKWESEFEKPFLNQNKSMPYLEFCAYIKCMTLNEVSDQKVYLSLTKENLDAVRKYIERPMTATTFNDRRPQRGRRQIITAEIIYSQMAMLQIPFECQYWHFNRLLTLIRVCAIANDPKQGGKMKKKDVLSEQAKLNAMRKAKMGTKG